MSKRTEYILIISFIVLTIVGIVFGIVAFCGQDAYANEKTIVLEDKVQSEMKVSLTNIVPGESCNYSLHLKANKGDKFDVVMDFEKTDADSLAKFIDVDIIVNGESIGMSTLAELLEGKQIKFIADFDGTKTVEVEIIYSMSVDIGDEAQHTSADFNILLTSKR